MPSNIATAPDSALTYKLAYAAQGMVEVFLDCVNQAIQGCLVLEREKRIVLSLANLGAMKPMDAPHSIHHQEHYFVRTSGKKRRVFIDASYVATPTQTCLVELRNRPAYMAHLESTGRTDVLEGMRNVESKIILTDFWTSSSAMLDHTLLEDILRRGVEVLLEEALEQLLTPNATVDCTKIDQTRIYHSKYCAVAYRHSLA